MKKGEFGECTGRDADELSPRRIFFAQDVLERIGHSVGALYR